jgi:hypothetical protein
LQCIGAKDATCLSPAQIQAVKKINQGPRNSKGQEIAAPAGAVAEDHVTNIAQGYAWDGGWMTTVGIPTRKIGSPGRVPGDFALGVGGLGYAFLSPAQPRGTTRWAPPARPRCTVIIGLVFGRGTDIRRPQIAARSSRRLHLGRCQPAAQSSRRRTRNLPAFFARLRTADHRQFMLSKDRCSGSPLRAPACHLRYPRIEDDRQVGARDRVRKRPSACRRKD